MLSVRNVFIFFKFLVFIAALLPFYFLLKVIFFFWNSSLFSLLNVKRDLWDILIFSFQTDIASIILINFIVIFLMMGAILQPGRKRVIFLKIAYWWAIVINSLGFALNILDIGYFKFNKERSTTGLLSVFTGSLSSARSIISIYWPLFILFLIVVILLALLLKSFFKTFLITNQLNIKQEFVSGLLTVSFLFIMVRGWHNGLLIPATPLLKVSPANLPLAQNSIHNFLYSIVRTQNQLQKKDYFTPQQISAILTTDRVMGGEANKMIKKNVIIFILESFSRDYFQPGNPYRAITPFFDSLMSSSTYYPNAFANGATSNQGIVSILAGLPPFIDEPFYYSTYANTKMVTIGDIFKKKGYNTNFFMGAGEDHFGFGKFCKMIGIDHYYGRKAFNDDRYYDGNWGIFDEPFLQFGIRELNKRSTPFFSVFFTISSHPPFTIPEKYKLKFNYPGQSPAQHSISYVDYAFRQFFDSCKNTSWFKNTLFVFSADHWLGPDDGAIWSPVFSSAIPIFIFDPANPVGKVDSIIAGQVDVIPTVLDKLNYSGQYTGFGRSLLDTTFTNRYVVNRMNSIHQVITDRFVLGYNEPLEKVEYLYSYSGDPELKRNLADNPDYRGEKEALKTTIRANIQQYNNSLLRRSLYSE
jgi:phosphoglycerol transferase MdoB-like AlkP superfamily enzyme